MEKTLVMVKPDGLQRGLIGEIVSRFERKGLKLLAIKMINFDDEILDVWYAHHKDRPYFPRIRSYITSTPMIAMVWEGLDAIATVRRVVGVTKAREAEAGSIRGDLGMSQQNNLIHASDSAESAVKEMGLLFGEKEIFEYQSLTESLIYSEEDRGL